MAALEAWSIEDGSATQPAFTEVFEYDSRGRQTLHASFEGIVTEDVYDSFGRMSAINYYDVGDYTSSSKLVSHREEFIYDDHGRRTEVVRYEASP
ncbi:MAG: hypothetical protein KDB00_13650, partial [Planctomycetales bacterium]|nr:hypothetical protein [Planctomycetales bacterium]